MTTHNPSSDTPPQTPPHCVGHCVGTASAFTPRAPSETTASDRPLPYGGRHSQRAPLTASATTASTASEHPTKTRTCRVCGCTDWAACTGPNDYACWWVAIDLCSSCQDGV
jgi:hypothetical protein